MIEPDLRKAVVTLHAKGRGIRQIAKLLEISRVSVRKIIKDGGEVRLKPRADMIVVAPELLAQVYKECSGWRERMLDKLRDEHKVAIGYSTLTRRVREMRREVKKRAAHVPDQPGEEMQNDTSPYTVKIGTRMTPVIGCSLYYRYSKEFYLEFFHAFDRFRMKCFFHDALVFYGYAAARCIIDNTHLAVLRGTGKDAVMHPEMVAFAQRYAFVFKAHEKGHSDRKAGEERGFWTVETNFFPGRTFSSLEDLNHQALVWATEIRANKERAKSKLIPAEAFEYEKAFLTKIDLDLPPPYRVHSRGVDQYGWIAFNSNFYWLPGEVSGDVQVLEYAREIKIYAGRREVARYPLPPWGTKNKIFPENRPHIPYQPRHRENPTAAEEAQLRRHSKEVGAFIDFALKGTGALRHRYIRELHALSRRLSPDLFGKVVARAHHYGVRDIKSLEEIARLLVRDDSDFMPELPETTAYEQQEGYLEGRITDDPDIKPYAALTEDDDSDDHR